MPLAHPQISAEEILVAATLNRTDNDVALIVRDEETFFRIVQTTPDYVEADDLLRRAKTFVIREKAINIQQGNTKEDQRLGGLLTKINSEIHYLSQRKERWEIFNAVRALWGEDGVKRVAEWRALNQYVDGIK